MEMSTRFVRGLFGLLAVLVASTQAGAQNTCKNEASAAAFVDSIAKTLPRVPPAASSQVQTPSAQAIDAALHDTIYLHVNGLDAMLAELRCWRQTQPSKQ